MHCVLRCTGAVHGAFGSGLGHLSRLSAPDERSKANEESKHATGLQGRLAGRGHDLAGRKASSPCSKGSEGKSERPSGQATNEGTSCSLLP